MEVNEMLLGLLGRALFAADLVFDPKSVPWADLFAESRAQTVELLAFDALTNAERAQMPTDVAAAWQTAALQRLGQNEQLRYEQSRILAALEAKHIPAVILKGSSCGEFYPNSALRCAGDIDLLVGQDGIAPARRALEALDYAASQDPHPFHLHMRKGHQVAELHHEPAGIPADEMGEQLRAYFDGAERGGEVHHGLPILSTQAQAVTLLLHKLEHIVSSGLGLRQMCDWAVFVHTRLTPEQWQSLEPTLKDFGLLRFTQVVTRICVDHLYLPKTSAPWCLSADKALADRLLEDILRTGNFGRKENRYGQRLFTDAGSGSRLTSFIKVGTQACRDHWPACEKHPILLPVAPVYLLVRYRKHRKQGRRPAFRPGKVYKTAKDRQALYAALKPFQT